ncbi:AbrB/MazE/SpoVT family DNA-binding domain-containing protein [Opitutia bacterium ISCC 51]|nr:AbrB/MazE/SpoVT family DNA-binding domain-containing protein [Opitutae bacterium ISCC 51]QXD28579.1 AbrB/MazE/SpoVT family DNA-binding domain-containing protein [Opitutae bacterium ISCC 52]
MVLKLKLRKVGNSIGVVIPKEALAKMESKEGDTLVLSETPDGGFRVTPDKESFADQMAVAEDIANRYRNTLNELAK